VGDSCFSPKCAKPMTTVEVEDVALKIFAFTFNMGACTPFFRPCRGCRSWRSSFVLP